MFLACYGPWQTVYGLFRRWQRDGTWKQMLAALQALADVAGLVTSGCECGFHGLAGRIDMPEGARKNADLQVEPPGGVDVEPEDHTLGRSRGGFPPRLTSPLNRGRRPLSLLVTAGQRGDSPQFEAVLDGICVARIGGWAATRVRLRGLQAASRGGVLHQQAQTQPSRGHPLRQTRRPLRSRRPRHRLYQRTAPLPFNTP